MTLVTAIIVWVVITPIGEGRFPKVEVRKMNSHKITETMEKEPFIHTSSDKKNEIMLEDAPEMTNGSTGLDGFTSEVLANAGEDCWEERVPIRLFVYGVRHHLSN